MESEGKCPFSDGALKHTVKAAPSNAYWWPNQLKLNILNQHSSNSDPMGKDFNYARSSGIWTSMPWSKTFMP